MMHKSNEKEPEPEAPTVKLLLYSLVRPAGSHPVSTAFDAAEMTDKRARAAYETGNFSQAAALFLEVAGHLRLPEGGPYSDTFAANRALAYANAAAAWIMADGLERARGILLEAADVDPACGQSVTRLLSELSALDTFESSI